MRGFPDGIWIDSTPCPPPAIGRQSKGGLQRGGVHIRTFSLLTKDREHVGVQTWRAGNARRRSTRRWHHLPGWRQRSPARDDSTADYIADCRVSSVIHLQRKQFVNSWYRNCRSSTKTPQEQFQRPCNLSGRLPRDERSGSVAALCYRQITARIGRSTARTLIVENEPGTQRPMAISNTKGWFRPQDSRGST